MSNKSPVEALLMGEIILLLELVRLRKWNRIDAGAGEYVLSALDRSEAKLGAMGRALPAEASKAEARQGG